jgi:exopolysaccharide/PEP-CTERM locus tyrosine autokinase
LRYEELDLVRLAAAGMVTQDSARSHIFEEFRLIKRPLLKNALGQGPAAIKRGNLIMVTSCMPSEGKSFCALNLAMSIAMEMDHTVLLVDADVAKPSLPRMLNIGGGLGLMDVLLEDNLPISQALIRTNIDKLKLLTSGRRHSNATELLASGAMRDLLDEISSRYSDRIIIFDSPPLLATTEARVLATQMGQVVVVVEAGKTSQHNLREALGHIESCENVSLILNKTRFQGGSGYYDYGYGYGSEADDGKSPA